MRYWLTVGALSVVLAGNVLKADDQAVEKPNVFKYQAPQGWTVQKSAPGGQIAEDMKDGSPYALIEVEMDRSSDDLRKWVDDSVARNKTAFAQFNAQFRDVTEFQTASGAKGYKVVVVLFLPDKKIRSVQYVFAGSHDAKIVATCTCPSAEAEHYEPIFDAAMKTFVAE